MLPHQRRERVGPTGAEGHADERGPQENRRPRAALLLAPAGDTDGSLFRRFFLGELADRSHLTCQWSIHFAECF